LLSSKRWVFSNDLNGSTVETDLIQRLKLFHNLGAATAKAPSPFVVGLVLGTSRSSWFADCRSLAAVHAFKRSSKSG